MNRLWPFFIAVLLGLGVCNGATNSSPSADVIFKQLAATPYDRALLATLANASMSVSNAEDRARYLAAYCLGALANGDNDAANKGKAHLAKTFPSSPHLQVLSSDNLSDACPACRGDGKAEGSCSICKGTGKCTACRGTGSVKRSRFSGSRVVDSTENCSACRGSGQCKQCKGTQKELRTCTRCSGSGRVWSLDRVKTEYLAMLAGAGSGGPSPTSGTALDFSDLTGRTTASSPRNAPSPVAQVRTVEVQGTGSTADEALKDAFSSAVKSCIGVMVNAEQVVENEDVIKDEILTYSNGYIKDYDDLGTETREGLVVRRIRATVILGKLATKLREKNIAVNEIKGEALFAEAVTVNQERADFKSMLTKLLGDYDPSKLWTPQLIEKKIVFQDADRATVAFHIRVIPNKTAVTDFFLAFQKILQTKYRQQRLQLVQYDNGQTHDYRMVEGLLGEGCVRVGTEDILPFQYFPKAGSMIVFVNRAATRALTEQERQDRDNAGIDRVYTEASCYAFQIPSDDWNTYFKGCVFTSRDGPVNSAGSAFLHSSQATPFIVGVLRASDGKEIDFFESEVEYSLVGRSGFGWHGPYGLNQEGWVILLHAESYPGEQYRVPWVYRLRDRTPLIVEKTFSLDELRAIKNIELAIEMRSSGEDAQSTRRGNATLSAPNVAASPEPQEKQAVRLAQKAMQAGTAALGVEPAVSQLERDSESSDDSQTKAAAAVAKAGEAATVAMVQNDGRSGLTAGEVFAAIAVIVVLIVLVKFGRLVRCILVGVAARMFGRR